MNILKHLNISIKETTQFDRTGWVKVKELLMYLIYSFVSHSISNENIFLAIYLKSNN